MPDEGTTPAPQTTADAAAEMVAKQENTKPKMAVKVYAPFQVFFEGDAYSVSAVNEVGPFDILPRHHNFLCMLVPCTVRIDGIDGPKEVKVSRALMHVKADRVVVFVDV